MSRLVVAVLLALAVSTSLVSADFKAVDFTDTPSPNKPIEKPGCDVGVSVSILYEKDAMRIDSTNGDRGGCITLDQVWEARAGKGPLYAVDPETGDISDTITGTWLLTESLHVLGGVTLQIWGAGSDGLADELRLKSTPDIFINLKAHGGSLDFENTKVFSWDTDENEYDTDESDGRSYISAISEVITDPDQECKGKAKNMMGEARMDIVKSEMGYLGYHDTESYGMTWKVRGFCVDKSNPELFDEVAVYGNIYDSELHHNNFAVYTYGHQQGDWRRNVVHSNSGYGFDPHDDSDHLTIHDNIVYNNAWHGIIASKRCNDVSIQGNTVYGGGKKSAGIFLHRSSDNGIVKNNHVYGNGDSGMALHETFNAVISDNIFEDNKYGVRLSVGCGDNLITNNHFEDTKEFALYTYDGSDSPEVADSGRPQNNVFDGNTIVGGKQSIKIKEADGTQIINNVFKDAKFIEWLDSEDNLVADNTGLDDVKMSVDDSCFVKGSDEDFKRRC